MPTAEVPLTNLHRGEILDGRELPIRYTALHAVLSAARPDRMGRTCAGLIRQHQFDKVELVKLHDAGTVVRRARSADARTPRRCSKRLELPYRTMLLCTGDMGFASAKTYDIEVWLPSQKTYREISSCSNTEAFQARRANIKFRAGGTGKAEFVHALNGSGLAVGRTLIAILENYQQKDGCVVVPAALRPYMDGGRGVIQAQALIEIDRGQETGALGCARDSGASPRRHFPGAIFRSLPARLTRHSHGSPGRAHRGPGSSRRSAGSSPAGFREAASFSLDEEVQTFVELRRRR